jgi:hypothetical protein
MKGEKRLNEIDDKLDDLHRDLRSGIISEDEFSKEFTPLRKEMALILYNDAKREFAQIELEIKRTERDLEDFTRDGLVIMATPGIKNSEKLVENIIATLKLAIKREKKSRTNCLRVMKDESKYL